MQDLIVRINLLVCSCLIVLQIYWRYRRPALLKSSINFVIQLKQKFNKGLLTRIKQQAVYKKPVKDSWPMAPSSHNKQYLLLRDLRCGHRFYCSWNWITVRQKMNKGIQCQHKDCFDVYYKQAYRPGNKMPGNKILAYFTNLFNAQYYPVHPNQAIKIREPIEVSHLPTGRKFKTSVDNFRRGKFRCIFKKLSSMELSQLFPQWTTNNIS